MTNLQDFVDAIGGIINFLIPLSVGAAFLFFFWGLALFIRDSGDGKKTEEGKNKMLWGVIVLFVMVSIWGIVEFLQSDLLGFIGGSGGGATEIAPIRNQ